MIAVIARDPHPTTPKPGVSGTPVIGKPVFIVAAMAQVQKREQGP